MSLVRGMDRILGRQVSVLPPRCTVYSFQRKRRKRRGKRRENGDWQSIPFYSLLSWFWAGWPWGTPPPGRSAPGPLLLRHTDWRSARDTHRAEGSPARAGLLGLGIIRLTVLPQPCPGASQTGPRWLSPPSPHTACRALLSFTRTGKEPKNPSTHASSRCHPLGLSQTVPGLVTKTTAWFLKKKVR